MAMTCEKCGKQISTSEGTYVFYLDRMMFACSSCANKVEDEMKCTRKICAAVDKKKTQAELVIQDKAAYDKFLVDIEATMRKIPSKGNLREDIPLLVSMVRSYISGEYNGISYNSIVALTATLLYVISPFDIIPDAIPAVGFTDDAIAVTLCKKMIHDDLERFKSWQDQEQRNQYE